MQDEYFWLATGGGNNDVNAQYSLYDGHRYAIHNKIVQNMQREYGPKVRMMHTKAVVDAPYADRPTQEESDLLLETMSAQSNDWLRSVLMEVRRDHKALGRHPIQIRNDATLLDQILAYPMGEVYRVLKRQDVHFKRMIALYRQYGLPDDDEWSMIEQYTIPMYDDPSWASLMDRSLQFQDQLFGPNFLVKPAQLNLSDRSQWIWVLDRRILFWMMMDGDQQLVDEIRTLRQSKYYDIPTRIVSIMDPRQSRGHRYGQAMGSPQHAVYTWDDVDRIFDLDNPIAEAQVESTTVSLYQEAWSSNDGASSASMSTNPPRRARPMTVSSNNPVNGSWMTTRTRSRQASNNPTQAMEQQPTVVPTLSTRQSTRPRAIYPNRGSKPKTTAAQQRQDDDYIPPRRSQRLVNLLAQLTHDHPADASPIASSSSQPTESPRVLPSFARMARQRTEYSRPSIDALPISRPSTDARQISRQVSPATPLRFGNLDRLQTPVRSPMQNTDLSLELEESPEDQPPSTSRLDFATIDALLMDDDEPTPVYQPNGSLTPTMRSRGSTPVYQPNGSSTPMMRSRGSTPVYQPNGSLTPMMRSRGSTPVYQPNGSSSPMMRSRGSTPVYQPEGSLTPTMRSRGSTPIYPPNTVDGMQVTPYRPPSSLGTSSRMIRQSSMSPAMDDRRRVSVSSNQIGYMREPTISPDQSTSSSDADRLADDLSVVSISSSSMGNRTPSP